MFNIAYTDKDYERKSKVWKTMEENQRSYYYQDQEVTTQKIIVKNIRKLDSTQMMIYL